MPKINRNKIEQFLQWEGGQRLFNFAYSIGAAVVILGALFKILHMPGGNTLIMIGMGTEVLMFILTAFDRPPKEYHWEEVYPKLRGKGGVAPLESEDEQPAEEDIDAAEVNVAGSTPVIQGGGTVIIGNIGQSGIPAATAPATGTAVPSMGGQPMAADDAEALSATIRRMSAAAEQLEQFADMTQATRDFMTRMAAISDQLERLNDTTMALNGVSKVLLDSYRTITENSETITRSSTGYVKEMEALNKNVGGLNTIYEIQLKSISSQLDSIDRVNRGIKDIRDMYERSASQSALYAEETEKMARYMQQLNHVYENMIHAMTVNMYRPGAMPPAASAE